MRKDTAGERRERRSVLRVATSYIEVRSSMVSRNAWKRLVLIQIADVLAHERLAVHNQRDGVLQIGADGENRSYGSESSPPAAEHSRAHGAESRGRTFLRERWNRPRGARWDARRSGTHRQCPPDVAHASSSSIGNRLARAIRAGHHQHLRRAGGEQQVMQRRVGQHHAEIVVVGRHVGQV